MNNSGYFDKILFRNSENSLGTVPVLKYEYTEINRARQLCWPKRKLQKSKGKKYPNGNSYDMQFGNGNNSSGYATPLSVGDQFYQQYINPNTPSSSGTSKSLLVEENFRQNGHGNISYEIVSRLLRGKTFGGEVYSSYVFRSYGEVEISTEGIYD